MLLRLELDIELALGSAQWITFKWPTFATNVHSFLLIICRSNDMFIQTQMQVSRYMMELLNRNKSGFGIANANPNVPMPSLPMSHCRPIQFLRITGQPPEPSSGAGALKKPARKLPRS